MSISSSVATAVGPPPYADIQRTVTEALKEDVGNGDLTAALIPDTLSTSATIITREEAILCGSAWVDKVFQQLDAGITIKWQASDGDPIKADEPLCELAGNAAAMLTGERTAMNFLQTLSATATLAGKYSEAVSGTSTKILDTRKTIPGLRTAQKYAVRCGGCHNHRIGLYDGILIKENHIAAAGSIKAAIESAKKIHADTNVKNIEIEVENLGELQQALDAKADILLLDNFDINTLREAVKITDGRAKLEASGGINLENVRHIAETGVDYISVGDLTKNVTAIDLSMRFE